MTNCEFCSEINQKHSRFSSQFASRVPNRFIAQTDNFLVMPSLGQLVEGHLLIVSRDHKTASALLPHGQLEELERLANSIHHNFEKLYGRFSFAFEHGVLHECFSGGCGINHMHVHVIPTNREIPTNDLDHSFSFRELLNLQDILSANIHGPGYLLLRNSLKQWRVAPANNLPSQFMRRFLAKELNLNEWDWREDYQEERLIATLNALSGLMVLES